MNLSAGDENIKEKGKQLQRNYYQGVRGQNNLGEYKSL